MSLFQLVVQYHKNLLDKLLFHMLAKIIALDTPTSEAEFLKNLLCDFSLLNKPIPPIPMHCDSQVAIYKVTNKNFNEKKEDT